MVSSIQKYIHFSVISPKQHVEDPNPKKGLKHLYTQYAH